MKFKRGFNGDYTEFIGEMDLVLKPAVYFAVEKGTSVFKELRRQIYLLRHRDKAPTKKKGEPGQPGGTEAQKG